MQVIRSGEDQFDLGGLTPKQAAFVNEYLVDYNGTQAAIRAGYSEDSAGAIATENLTKPLIRIALQRRMAALADAAAVDATLVISELYSIAMADPRDLVRVETDCCRHCHGIDHRYHWTEPEYRRALDAALKAGMSAPEIEGGFGFDPRKEPHLDCPDCFGRGIERVTVTASRKLSKAAAKLLASMKQAKDGSIELKTRDQDAALIALGRVVGAFRDRQELSGPAGGPLQLQPVTAIECDLRVKGADGHLVNANVTFEVSQPSPVLEPSRDPATSKPQNLP